MADLCALTFAEARAILIADDSLAVTCEARLASGQTFGIDEREAWINLVASARVRIAEYDRPVAAPTPYPGGNLPDVQTLLGEAVAAHEEKRRKTVEEVRARLRAIQPPAYVTVGPPAVAAPVSWQLSTVSTKSLLHAFRVTLEGGAWSLCGLVQLVNTADFDPALFQDRCKSCVRFARRYEEKIA